ncbi:MAG: hypothetical protein AB7J63_15840 [Vicinamibacterales bacterium]
MKGDPMPSGRERMLLQQILRQLEEVVTAYEAMLASLNHATTAAQGVRDPRVLQRHLVAMRGEVREARTAGIAGFRAVIDGWRTILHELEAEAAAPSRGTGGRPS